MTPPPARESLTPSLLTTIVRRLSRDAAVSLLGSESPRVRRLAADWLLARFTVDEIEALLLPALGREDSICVGALELLRHQDLDPGEVLHGPVVSLLKHGSSTVRRAAVPTIVRRWPEDTLLVLAEPQCRQDQQILRLLCLADDPKLTLPLLQAFGFPDRGPPPTIGFLVNATWLADQHADYPLEVEWLIRECGYCDDTITTDVLDLLSLGLSTVVPAMTAKGPADKWVERVRGLSWRLLSKSTDAGARDVRPVDLNDSIDTALFLAAVRDVDRLLFAERRTNPAWDLRRLNAEPTAVCFHAPTRHVRRLFLDGARAAARELHLSDEDLGEFVVDYARSSLEVVPERRIEAEQEWCERWQLRQRPSASLKSLVIGEFRRRTPEEGGSPCAQSICSLAELAGLDVRALSRWLQECEQRWARILTPIGIELQIPNVAAQQFGPWKEALVSLGVPSPARPEFGRMLEAAFRPARSWHAPILAPALLHRLGVISATKPQEIALHISLQGDLGPQARDLVFPQLFINRTSRRHPRPEAVMTRVLSKGLVHRNTEIELLDSPRSDQVAVRTELRVFRLQGDEPEEWAGVSSPYFHDLIATHLLGSAMLGKCTSCRETALAYGSAVATGAASLGPSFERQLHSNYYESTGDPHDEVLMNYLGVFRAWSDVRRLVNELGQHDELRQLFTNLRSHHVAALIDHLTRDHGIDWSRELGECDQFLKAISPQTSGAGNPAC